MTTIDKEEFVKTALKEIDKAEKQPYDFSNPIMEEMTIKISIDSADLTSLAHQRIVAGIFGYLKSLVIPIQHAGEGQFIVNGIHIASDEENQNFRSGADAYRYAVMHNGFKGSETEWLASLLDKQAEINQIPFHIAEDPRNEDDAK